MQVVRRLIQVDLSAGNFTFEATPAIQRAWELASVELNQRGHPRIPTRVIVPPAGVPASPPLEHEYRLNRHIVASTINRWAWLAHDASKLHVEALALQDPKAGVPGPVAEQRRKATTALERSVKIATCILERRSEEAWQAFWQQHPWKNGSRPMERTDSEMRPVGIEFHSGADAVHPMSRNAELAWHAIAQELNSPAPNWVPSRAVTTEMAVRSRYNEAQTTVLLADRLNYAVLHTLLRRYSVAANLAADAQRTHSELTPGDPKTLRDSTSTTAAATLKDLIGVTALVAVNRSESAWELFAAIPPPPKNGR